MFTCTEFVFVKLTLLHLKFFQFKMAALNKRAVLAAMLVILRRRRRRRIKKNKANFKKRLWTRPINADRLSSGAFYSTFIVLKSLDRCEFFRSVVLNFFNWTFHNRTSMTSFRTYIYIFFLFFSSYPYEQFLKNKTFCSLANCRERLRTVLRPYENFH